MLSLLFMLCGLPGLSPAIAVDEIPTVGQPTKDFYRAIGNRVRVEWQVDRTTVPEDEAIVATLVVRGVTNPRQVIRPDLRKLEPFETRFVIEDGRDPLPAADADEVRFSYRLRPRNRSVDRLPTLAFHYYNPAAFEGKSFPLTTARFADRLTVTAAAPKVAPRPLPLAEPDHLFAIATGPGVLGQPFVPGRWVWLAVVLAGPVAAALWYVAWRRVYPDAARLARLRRSRAARRAIAALRRADRVPDPPAAIAAALLNYFRALVVLPPEAATPPEIRAALITLGLAESRADRIAAFFRDCDTVRFSGIAGGAARLANDGEAIVAEQEGAA